MNVIRWVLTLPAGLFALVFVIVMTCDFVVYLYQGRVVTPDLISRLEAQAIFGTVFGAALAFTMAWWRIAVAERQAAIAEHSLFGERYRNGVEMLAHDSLSVRLGASFSLYSLACMAARDRSLNDEVNQIMNVFCAFVRFPVGESVGAHFNYPSPSATYVGSPESEECVRQDVQIILMLLGLLLKDREYLPDLRRSNLQLAVMSEMNMSGANLSDSDLAGAQLQGADLAGTVLFNVNMANANLTDANLRGANLGNANLAGADFTGADISGAEFSTPKPGWREAQGISREQVESARWDRRNPPKLPVELAGLIL